MSATEPGPMQGELALRLRELELLHNLSTAVAQAGSLEDIYRSALGVVLEAMEVERAALLLFDERGVMRFTSWLGLSDEYRRAVEGHSPWLRDEPDPRAIAVADVFQDETLAPYRPTFEREGIRALCFIPLVFENRLLGKFMVYFPVPHEFSLAELRLARTVANHVAVAIVHKREEDALRRSEERVRHALAAGRMGTWAVDLTRGLAEIDEREAELLGLPSSARELPLDAFLEPVHPEDRERVWPGTAERKPNGMFETEFRVSRPDGSIAWVSGHGSTVRDAQGRPVRSVGVHFDVTARKAAERALQARKSELEQSDRRKTEFLAVLGHELRNPLAAVSSGLELLQRTQDAERRKWVVEMMERNARQLSTLLEDLMDLTRISRGKMSLKTELVPLSAVLQRAVDAVDPLLAERHHRFRQSVEPGLHVLGDPTRLEQIVVNLLSNAAKYTDEGGWIDLSAACEGSQAVVRVRDTGVGIPPEMQGKIFEAFEQLRPNAFSRGGLGIGLTLVKQLVDLHGGTIAVDSEGAGRGSEFTVALPLARAAGAEGEAPRAPPSNEKPRGARVLIVDDNEDAARALALLLEEDGLCAVRIATDGASALAAAHEFLPEVVLLDIGLPDMSGYELARRLRREVAGHEALLIAVSGFGHEEARAASYAAGCHHHLAKPVDPAEILGLIAEGMPSR